MPILENYTLWIKDCRLSFPALVEPKPVQQGPAKYQATFIMQESQPEWAEAMQLVGQLAAEKWQEHAQNIVNMISGDKKLRCYGRGAEKVSAQTGVVYAGFDEPGVCFITGYSDSKPQLYGQNGQPLPPTANANELFVGGNYVSGIVRFWAQENQHGRGIRGQLVGVQYLREGEHFGSEEIDAASVFQPAPGAPMPTGAAPGMPAVAPAPAPVAPVAPSSVDFL